MIENLNPLQTWDLWQEHSNALLVDVRTKMEHVFVGHPPGSIHIAWKEAPDWQVNTHFVSEVEKYQLDKTVPVLLLCRSGQRSLEAAMALQAAGFTHLVNIIDGFEGPLDQQQHRGQIAGWRHDGLPWRQG
jgi:rhodanese-related sulfurtransferase